MLKQLLSLVALSVLAISLPAVSNAQSVNMQDALARMNTIIAEMEKLRTEFSTLASSVGQTTTTPTPSVLGAATSAIFTHPLVFGETNDDIKRIQKLLATDPEIYSHGVVSGYFGPKTEEAIKNLQARNGWDTPGVIGPATRDLLERYFKAHPDENWPTEVLKSAPRGAQVLGSSTSVGDQLAQVMQALSGAQSQTTSGAAGATGTNLAKKINVTLDDGEALIEILYTNGNRKGLVADTTNKPEIVSYIARNTVLTEAMITAVISYNGNSSNDDSDGDEGDAEDALDAAEEAIDEADEEIKAADEDGEDVDWAEDTLTEAEDLFEEAEEAFNDEEYGDAEDLANEAEELANDAEDRIGEEEENDNESEDIEEISVDVAEGESEVTVEYENGDDEEFTVEEDAEDDIIEAIADELNIDEDDVEDLVEFDYGDVDRIEVRIDETNALVRVFYESGLEQRLRPNETDEDEIIAYIADELNMDEDEVEELVDF